MNLLFVGTAAFLVYASLLIETKEAEFAVSPRMIPLCLSSMMVVLGASVLIADLLKKPAMKSQLSFQTAKSLAGFLTIVFAYVLLMGVINFHVLTFCFLIVSFYFFGLRSPVRVVCTALCLVAVELLVFQYGFNVVYP